jgi:soluble lytic murein transglycosylase
MAVPIYSNFQTSQTAAPDVNVQAPSGPSAGQVGAAQADAMGRAAAGAGDAVSHIALAMQDQINQTRVNDAMNQARIAAQKLTYDPQVGYKNQLGNDALERQSGQPLSVEYGDKLNEAVSGIAGALGNDAQRRAFAQSSAALATQFQGDVEAHTLQQFGVYHDSVNDATVALAKNTIEQNWQNPDVIFGGKDPNTGQPIPGAIDQIKAATMAKAKQHGLEGAPADAAILDAVSSSHRGVVQAALENGNPQYAMMYMDAARKRGELTGNDILALQAHVTQAVNLGVSAAAVSATTTEAAKAFAPTMLDRFQRITASSESGGQDMRADGTPVVSPVGAKYAMQVMPATAANPGHGIAPAASDTPAEYNRVGVQLQAALLQKYGDPALAWAAYNAGEGNVDKALKDADGGDWMSALAAYQSPANHKQTVDYVTKNVNALGDPTAGRVDRPTELQFVSSALSKLPPNASPQLVQMTREHATQQFDVVDKSFREQGDRALSAVQQWLYANQGHGATVADVPQQLMDDVLRFAPGDVGRPLESFSRALQRGDVVTNQGRYNDIVSNPGQYFKLPNSSWDMLQTELSPSTFQKLSERRAQWLNGTGDDSPNGLDHATIKRVLDERLMSAKLPTTAKLGTPDAQWLGATKLFVDQSIQQAQYSTNKRMVPAEIEAHIDKLFSASVPFRRTVFGYQLGSDTPHNLMGMHIDDLDMNGADVANLKAAFAKHGNPNPSPTDLLNAYRNLKLQNQ